MANLPDSENQHSPPQTPAERSSAAPVESSDHWMSKIGSLLEELEDISSSGRPARPVISRGRDNELIQVRLGTAASLFTALQCKNAASAGHCLRVALTCSAWAEQMDLEESYRDIIEVAALLHDVGMIGAPDNILKKPGVLDSDEASVMARSREMSLEILRQSCSSQEILDIVEHVSTWYNGNRDGFRVCGGKIPLGARMMAIVEAFDAMTTDQVYRPALSQERAIAELFNCAGTQFDSELVKRFAEFQQCDQSQLHALVAGRWLKSLDPEMVNSYWQLNCVPSPSRLPASESAFEDKLLESMYDAVVFIDSAGNVTLWNHGAERLTGIAGSSIVQSRWQPRVLKMRDEKGEFLTEADCPITVAIRSGTQSLRRLTIRGRSGKPVAVDTHAIPVIGNNNTTQGAILIMHDASSETSLEERCQSLHKKATKDPLTKVANRAEFDRVHEMFVSANQQQKVPCSLMILDLDHFKQVNDNFGHQAGDDAIISVAALLKNFCRPGDLVARYGGEEFVMLCADCDNAAAARRADQIRKKLAEIPQPRMGNKCVTASFGVTEIQPGDTPETMLRRADRALLMAKGKGRNTVVQLGVGSGDEHSEEKGGFWFRKPVRPEREIERVLVTSVPVKLAIEKLRGFVADHQAKIIKIDTNHVRLQLNDRNSRHLRRLSDRATVFLVDLRFEEERPEIDKQGTNQHAVVRTRIFVTISPKRNRDRRQTDFSRRAQELLTSFRSYLMATEEEYQPPRKALRRVRQILTPWLTKEQDK